MYFLEIVLNLTQCKLYLLLESITNNNLFTYFYFLFFILSYRRRHCAVLRAAFIRFEKRKSVSAIAIQKIVRGNLNLDFMYVIAFPISNRKKLFFYFICDLMITLDHIFLFSNVSFSLCFHCITILSHHTSCFNLKCVAFSSQDFKQERNSRKFN